MASGMILVGAERPRRLDVLVDVEDFLRHGGAPLGHRKARADVLGRDGRDHDAGRLGEPPTVAGAHGLARLAELRQNTGRTRLHALGHDVDGERPRFELVVPVRHRRVLTEDRFEEPGVLEHRVLRDRAGPGAEARLRVLSEVAVGAAHPPPAGGAGARDAVDLVADDEVRLISARSPPVSARERSSYERT